LDKNGKYLKDIIVAEHLRRQPYGKGMSEEKWIFISSYDSTRWKNNKDTSTV